MTDNRKLRRFTERMAEVYGVRPAEVPGILNGARSTSVRVNRLAKVPPEEIEARLTAVCDLVPVPWCDDAYFCSDVTNAIPIADQGLVYIQNASSLIPVVLLDPQPGEDILDVCSAPGGKAFHVAARTGGRARLWLNDSSPVRADRLRDLAARYEVRYEKVTTMQAQYIDKELPAQSFDRILLDVQCSGEGRVDLRRSDALRYWDEARIEKYKYMQTRMLEAAYKLLRPGGTMVYSTCTISPEENEFPVSQILNRHADLDVVAVDLGEPNFGPGLTSWRNTRFAPAVSRAVRVRPTAEFEGFFAARIGKVAEDRPDADQGSTVS